MVERVAVRGLKELNAELTRLPEKLAKKHIRKSLNAAAKPVKQRAKLLAPRKSGALRRGISSRSNQRRREKDRLRVSIFVKFNKRRSKSAIKRGDDPYYWYMQEFGFRAVGRTNKRSKRLQYKGRRGRERLRATGAKVGGKAYMRKAFNTTSGRALVTFKRTLNNQLEFYRAG